MIKVPANDKQQSLKEEDLRNILPLWPSGKESPFSAGDPGSIPGLGRFPGEGNGNPTSVFLPGKSHGQRTLAGYRRN